MYIQNVYDNKQYMKFENSSTLYLNILINMSSVAKSKLDCSLIRSYIKIKDNFAIFKNRK